MFPCSLEPGSVNGSQAPLPTKVVLTSSAAGFEVRPDLRGPRGPRGHELLLSSSYCCQEGARAQYVQILFYFLFFFKKR